MVFNTQGVNIKHPSGENAFNYRMKNVKAEELYELAPEDYRPTGGTPLRDAIKLAMQDLSECEGIDNEDAAVLFLIITDGEDTSSVNISANGLKEMIQAAEGSGRYTFTYLSTDDVDVDKVCQDYGINKYNTIVIPRSIEGAIYGSTAMFVATQNFFDARNIGMKHSGSFYSSDVKK